MFRLAFWILIVLPGLATLLTSGCSGVSPTFHSTRTASSPAYPSQAPVMLAMGSSDTPLLANAKRRSLDRSVHVRGIVPEEVRVSEGFDPAESAGLFVGIRHFDDRRFAEVPFAVDDAVTSLICLPSNWP